MKTIITSVYITKKNNKEKDDAISPRTFEKRRRKEKTMKEKKMLECSLTIKNQSIYRLHIHHADGHAFVGQYRNNSCSRDRKIVPSIKIKHYQWNYNKKYALQNYLRK
jgi:hypothetical protein